MFNLQSIFRFMPFPRFVLAVLWGTMAVLSYVMNCLFMDAKNPAWQHWASMLVFTILPIAYLVGMAVKEFYLSERGLKELSAGVKSSQVAISFRDFTGGFVLTGSAASLAMLVLSLVGMGVEKAGFMSGLPVPDMFSYLVAFTFFEVLGRYMVAKLESRSKKSTLGFFLLLSVTGGLGTLSLTFNELVPYLAGVFGALLVVADEYRRAPAALKT